ncbi:hypothetical protein, partial [Xanthomonas theicola]|uniref:hypothetical protein n=1 Tax=Xanthomonas theicola TaxID=56464 RepID=UPI001B805772
WLALRRLHRAHAQQRRYHPSKFITRSSEKGIVWAEFSVLARERRIANQRPAYSNSHKAELERQEETARAVVPILEFSRDQRLKKFDIQIDQAIECFFQQRADRRIARGARWS